MFRTWKRRRLPESAASPDFRVPLKSVLSVCSAGAIPKTIPLRAYLLRHLPGRGWPLSQVTALELLAGIHFAGSADFLNVRQRIELAYKLSNGRILNDPRFLLCQEVLRIPFPSDKVP